MKSRANVKAVVVRKSRYDEDIDKHIPEKELVIVDLGYVVGNAPTREDVLRRKDVVEACEGVPSTELEVGFQSLPFQS